MTTHTIKTATGVIGVKVRGILLCHSAQKDVIESMTQLKEKAPS